MALLFEVNPSYLLHRNRSCGTSSMCGRPRRCPGLRSNERPHCLQTKGPQVYPGSPVPVYNLLKSSLTGLVQHLAESRPPVRTRHENLKDLMRDGLALDVSGFSPDEIRVKIKDRVVSVEARHEEGQTDSESYVLRQMRRQFTLPKDADSNRVSCEMNSQGQLYFKMPVSESKVVNVPISVDIVQRGEELEENGVTGEDQLLVMDDVTREDETSMTNVTSEAEHLEYNGVTKENEVQEKSDASSGDGKTVAGETSESSKPD